MAIRTHFSTTNLSARSAVCGEYAHRITLDVGSVTCKRCMGTTAFDTAANIAESLCIDCGDPALPRSQFCGHCFKIVKL